MFSVLSLVLVKHFHFLVKHDQYVHDNVMAVVFLSHLIKQSGPKVSKEKGAKEYRGLSCLTLRKVHFVLLLKRGKTNCNNRYVLDILRRCSRFKG